MAIELTERAAQEVKTILEQNSLPADNSYLRLGVKGGGCSGFSYALDLTETKNDTDEEWEVHGVRSSAIPRATSISTACRSISKTK